MLRSDRPKHWQLSCASVSSDRRAITTYSLDHKSQHASLNVVRRSEARPQIAPTLAVGLGRCAHGSGTRPTCRNREPKRLTNPSKLPGWTILPVTRSSLTMPGKAAKITITESQQVILQTFSRSVTAPSRLRQRASIILMAFDGLLNEEIAKTVGLVHRQVGRWRRRWANAWERLIAIECCESRAALRRAMEAVLTDEPRPGTPASSPQSKSPRSSRWPASPPRSPADRSPTGRPWN